LKGAAPEPGNKDHVSGKTPPVTDIGGAAYFVLVVAAGREIVLMESGVGGVTEIVYAWETANGVEPLLA
jgi:hypothetical protein